MATAPYLSLTPVCLTGPEILELMPASDRVGEDNERYIPAPTQLVMPGVPIVLYRDPNSPAPITSDRANETPHVASENIAPQRLEFSHHSREAMAEYMPGAPNKSFPGQADVKASLKKPKLPAGAMRRGMDLSNQVAQKPKLLERADPAKLLRKELQPNQKLTTEQDSKVPRLRLGASLRFRLKEEHAVQTHSPALLKDVAGDLVVQRFLKYAAERASISIPAAA